MRNSRLNKVYFSVFDKIKGFGVPKGGISTFPCSRPMAYITARCYRKSREMADMRLADTLVLCDLLLIMTFTLAVCETEFIFLLLAVSPFWHYNQKHTAANC